MISTNFVEKIAHKDFDQKSYTNKASHYVLHFCCKFKRAALKPETIFNEQREVALAELRT